MEYRILVVCQRYWPENQKLIDICEGFIERGMQVDVLCGQPVFIDSKKKSAQNKIKDPEIRNNVRIFRAYETAYNNGDGLSTYLNYISFMISSSSKIKSMNNVRYDRIFIYQVTPITMCAAGLRYGKKHNIPVAMYVVDLWPHSVLEELDVRSNAYKSILEKIARHYYGKADKLIVNSHNTEDYFINTLKISDDKVKYISQSAEKIYENTKPDENLLERFAGSFNIVYVGEIGYKQRFLTVIEAMEYILKDGIKNIRFIIVGDGATLDIVKEEVENRKMTRYFFFEGPKDNEDISYYLDMADVLLDTRRADEALDFYVPSRVASYMAAQKPLLLSMGGDADDIIKEADCGFVSEPEDSKSLYQNILKLYRMSRNERRVLGINAKEYQREFFNRDKTIVSLMEEINLTHTANETIETGSKDEKRAIKETVYDWIDDEFK